MMFQIDQADEWDVHVHMEDIGLPGMAARAYVSHESSFNRVLADPVFDKRINTDGCRIGCMPIGRRENRYHLFAERRTVQPVAGMSLIVSVKLNQPGREELAIRMEGEPFLLAEPGDVWVDAPACVLES